jgi:hypothetical protein
VVARVRSVAFQGIDVVEVEAQVVITSGLPAFTVVGLPDKAVAESRERVRAALTSMGLALPSKRITVNLAPADILKEGSHFDLPIALGLLAAMEVLSDDQIAGYVALGELSLDGSILPVAGVLPAAMGAVGDEMTIKEWEAAFPDEDACCAYLVRHRWPAGVACPRCGNVLVKPHGTMKWNWLCNECGQPTNYRFSHITGTIFENTNKPLRDWFRVIHKMLVSKKGISAVQVYREMGFGSYKTAWYMCMRIRTALQNKEFQRMMGIVEIDETFIGGKKKNRHVGQRGMGSDGPKGGAGGKAIVMGAASRTKKTVVARVVENVSRATVRQFVAQMCEPKISIIATDEYPSYKSLSEDL